MSGHEGPKIIKKMGDRWLVQLHYHVTGRGGMLHNRMDYAPIESRCGETTGYGSTPGYVCIRPKGHSGPHSAYYALNGSIAQKLHADKGQVACAVCWIYLDKDELKQFEENGGIYMENESKPQTETLNKDNAIPAESLKRLKELFQDSMDFKLSSVPASGQVSVKEFLTSCEKSGWVKKTGPAYLLLIDLDHANVLLECSESYHDYSGAYRILHDIFTKGYGGSVLLIGEAGLGKTTLVTTLVDALQKQGLTNGLVTLNGSDGTKRHDLIGMVKVKPDGTFEHHPAGVARAMLEGKVFYLDEANTIPAGVLVGLDECLDNRKEVNISISSDEVRTIRAKPGFFVFSTVNPLTVTGCRAMPPQLFSRYDYVLHLTYPKDIETEMKVVQTNTKSGAELNALRQCIKVIQLCRSDKHDLPYRPTVRESIICHKLLAMGYTSKQALEMTIINRGQHWSDTTAETYRTIIKTVIPM